jgi:serine/threonine-protein kinase
MEYLEGETLAELLEREGAVPWRQACEMASQIADGLGAAHRHRIVHRDVKPANVMRLDAPEAPGVASAPVIKVLDFGVAKLLQESQLGARTHPGKLLGTPEYMAPEQCGGEGTVDARTDIYALGCVLYEMVSGNPPFPVETLNDLIVAHRWREPPAAASAADVPLALDRLIARMLAKRQEDRPPNMDGVARALRDVLGRPDEITVAAAPTVSKAATTRLGRPEASTRALGKSGPARAPGRSLIVALAAAGLATAGSLGVRAVHSGPPRQAVIIDASRVMIRPPAPPEPATQAEPAVAAVAVAATAPPSTHARAVTSGPSPPAAPAIPRRARESGRARASHPMKVDADGIVNL